MALEKDYATGSKLVSKKYGVQASIISNLCLKQFLLFFGLDFHFPFLTTIAYKRVQRIFIKHPLHHGTTLFIYYLVALCYFNSIRMCRNSFLVLTIQSQHSSLKLRTQSPTKLWESHYKMPAMCGVPRPPAQLVDQLQFQRFPQMPSSLIICQTDSQNSEKCYTSIRDAKSTGADK